MIELPLDAGRYRVAVSSLQENVCWHHDRGRPFLMIDAEVVSRRARLLGSAVTTKRALRRRAALRAAGRGLRYPFTRLWRNRSLMRSMVGRDIAARYRGSFAGLFWTVLNPLLLMATYFFVFGIVLRTKFGHDPSRAGFSLYFLCGMLPWLAISEALGRAPLVILEYRNFVKKLVFPLEILPVNLALTGLVTEALALGIFSLGLLAARGALPPAVAYLPALVVPQLLFTAGLCWFMAALGTYVRDLGHVNGFLLTLWFFLTPICYPAESLPKSLMPVLSHNPLFLLVRSYRMVFLEGRYPDPATLCELWAIASAVFFLGYAWFHRLQKDFADVV
jgi:lipopolysaccharide transport system permease protein